MCACACAWQRRDRDGVLGFNDRHHIDSDIQCKASSVRIIAFNNKLILSFGLIELCNSQYSINVCPSLGGVATHHV